MTGHDPGGRSRFPLLPGVKGGACFDGANMEHRLWLQRQVGDEGPILDMPFALWICMNPSTAGFDEDDPLVRKAWGFTLRMGLSNMILTNVGTYRCTDPSLLPEGVPLSHPDNVAVILAIAAKADKVIVACGNPPPVLARDAAIAIKELRGVGSPSWCLGRTLAGWPKHPGRIAYDTPLEPFT